MEGNVVAGNDAGTKIIGTGQYAYVADTNTAPQILPGNPGLDFALPPISSGGGQDGYGQSEKAPCDCVVR
jgi:hypothetical protein